MAGDAENPRHERGEMHDPDVALTSNVSEHGHVWPRMHLHPARAHPVELKAPIENVRDPHLLENKSARTVQDALMLRAESLRFRNCASYGMALWR